MATTTYTAHLTIKITHDADESPYTPAAIEQILSGVAGLDATVTETDPLVAAYHAVFNAKDEAERGSRVFVAGYAAGKAIATLIEATGGTVPRLFHTPRGAAT